MRRIPKPPAKLLIPLVLATLMAASSMSLPEGESGAQKPIQVLLIGNSYIYYNNLPVVLEAVAASLDGPPLTATMVAEGGASLDDHLDGERAPTVIRSGDWDYVVLIGQSTFGRVFLVEGRYRVGGHAEFLSAGQRLHELIAGVGAETVLLSHWKDIDAPSSDQKRIDAAYRDLSRHTGALVAPAGGAFGAIGITNPSLPLYAEDGHHPSPLGTYLAAAVLYTTITDRSPEGATTIVDGHPVDEGTGEILDRTSRLVAASEEQAIALQAAAWEAHREQEDGRLIQCTPPAVTLPGIPDGQPVEPSELAGDWEGPLHLYPWSARLQLRIAQTGGAVDLAATVAFGGQPDDIVVEPSEVNLHDGRLSFVDPDGPNGSTIRYVGVYDGFQLIGRAEMTTGSDTFYGIGSFALSKRE